MTSIGLFIVLGLIFAVDSYIPVKYDTVYLNEMIHPKNYQLRFDLSDVDNCDWRSCFYSVQVNITLFIEIRIKSILLHCEKDLIIHTDKTRLVKILGNGKFENFNILYHKKISRNNIPTLQIEVDMFQELHVANYLLMLYCTRKIGSHYGIYRPDPVDKNYRILVATHMLPTFARRVFPCFDELKWRSTFDIEIIHNKSYRAIANTALQYREEFSNQLDKSKFVTTLPITTSQLFLAVLSYVTLNRTKERPFNVWYRPTVPLENIQLVIKYVEKFLNFMTRTTSIRNITDAKMDIIIGTGICTSHWYSTTGVILFSENNILIDNKESTSFNKFRAITNIANAIAVQWIGVLIRPSHWNQFWVYKAMAQYVSYFLIHNVEPSWRVYDQLLARACLLAREGREYSSASSLSYYLFDLYEKMYFREDLDITDLGATLIRMMDETIEFRGIRQLMEIHFKNWVKTQYGPNIEAFLGNRTSPYASLIASDWINNPGIPVIHIFEHTDKSRISLTQERSYALGTWGHVLYKWWIPLKCFERSKYVHFWLIPTEPKYTLPIGMKQCLLNTTTFAVYRFNYPDVWWKYIFQELTNNHRFINEMQRMRIIDDLFHMIISDHQQPYLLSHLFDYLNYEVDYFPWLAAARIFKNLRTIFKFGTSEARKELFRNEVLRITNNMYQKMGFESNKDNDDHITRLHRGLIMDLSCSFHSEDCLTIMQKKLHCYVSLPDDRSNRYQENGTDSCFSDADIRETVLCQGLRHASYGIWLNVLDLVHDPNVFPATKSVIERSLACTEDPIVLNSFLETLLDTDHPMEEEDITVLLITAAQINEANAQIILRYIIRNYDAFVTKVDSPHVIAVNVHRIVQEVYDYETIDKVFLPFLRNISRSIDSSLVLKMKEAATTNLIIIGEIRPTLEKWFDEKTQNSEQRYEKITSYNSQHTNKSVPITVGQ